MRNGGELWKWLVSIGLAVGLMLAAALWLPRSWLSFLLAPRDLIEQYETAAPDHWLVLVPPPVIEVIIPETDELPEPETPPPPTLHHDPRWWQDGWAAVTANDQALFAPVVPTLTDTLQLLLTELGLGVDSITQARPDSLLAARLFLLQLEDGFRYEELKPYFESVTRARTYADINSRAADMYDEPLAQDIVVPD